MSEKKKIILINILLIGITIIIALILLLIFNIHNNSNNNLKAEIWYENNLIETIDLTNVEDNVIKDIKLKDDLMITIEYQKNAIRVISAPCITHECEKMGWTSSLTKPIICMHLHYKIILKQNNADIDVVI